MLLVIEGVTKMNGADYEKLNLDIPKLYLDNNDYKLCVRNVYIESKYDIAKQVIFLQTDAIDRTPFNLNQEIFVIGTNGSNYAFGETKHLTEYKIQLKEFHSSQFVFHCTRGLEGDVKVRILLEISRDVRIQ